MGAFAWRRFGKVVNVKRRVGQYHVLDYPSRASSVVRMLKWQSIVKRYHVPREKRGHYSQEIRETGLISVVRVYQKQSRGCPIHKVSLEYGLGVALEEAADASNALSLEKRSRFHDVYYVPLMSIVSAGISR
jgi:hypothetical protein